MNIFEQAAADPRLHTLLEDPRTGNSEIARQFGLSEAAVRRWRTKHGITLEKPIPGLNIPAQQRPAPAWASKGSIDVDSNGATLNNVVVEAPINEDWSHVFRLFNLDATKFEVVDDTVRMSTWQQSKGGEDGSRDTIQLWSYSARFRRVNKDLVSAEQVDQWRRVLMIQERPTEPQKRPNRSTYTILVSDPQLGKKGTEEAVENWKRGIEKHIAAAYRTGASRIHVAFQGDETEGVCNNYTNQPHTIELNLTKQLELDYDMRVWTLREVADVGVPVSVSSVISNHGEWTRNGSKDVVTTRSDNASTHVARQVKKLFDELEPFGGPRISWTIGDSDPGVVVNLSGIDAYFSHGYIEKGRGGATEIRTKNAIERQILGKTEALGATPLWFMAHYHHFYMQEFEGRTLFGCPALEAERSSEYMLDQYGVWSPPGMLGLLVGQHTPRGWSNLAVY